MRGVGNGEGWKKSRDHASDWPLEAHFTFHLPLATARVCFALPPLLVLLSALRCSQGAPISQVLQRIEWVYRASWNAFRALQHKPSYTLVIAFHAVVRPSTTLCLW